MGCGLWYDRNGAPEGAAADGRGPGRVGRSRGGCPTAGDTPLPVPHNRENQIMDLLCHSPFSDLLAEAGDRLLAVTLPQVGNAWPGCQRGLWRGGRRSSEVKSHKTRYPVTDADNLIKALARLPSGDTAA